MANSKSPQKPRRERATPSRRASKSITAAELHNLLVRGQELREQIHKKFKDSISIEDYEIKLRLR